jgi:hypothetical protein
MGHIPTTTPMVGRVRPHGTHPPHGVCLDKKVTPIPMNIKKLSLTRLALLSGFMATLTASGCLVVGGGRRGGAVMVVPAPIVVVPLAPGPMR